MKVNILQAHWQAIQDGHLPQFTVYNSPKDFPGKHVVRMWLVSHEVKSTNLVGVFDTLEQARAFVPPDLIRMPREEADDPVIVETWL